jgi:peptidylprolyl isomerase
VDGAQPAQITVPKTAAPTRLVVQPMIKGAGAVVKDGNSIKLSYTEVLWRNGESFGASLTFGGARKVVIGRGNVIPAWDKGLVGQTVGSRILLVVPPAEGFGTKGVPPQVGPTDTTVFVIDILAVN